MSTEPSELKLDLNLPDHTNELEEAEGYTSKIKRDILICKENNKLDNQTYKDLYGRITNALYFVGGLSIPAFDVGDKIEQEYFNTYKHAPELAKKLWLDHYARIHHPYNLLKNRLFRLYEILDELYKNINKSSPPNV